MALEKILWAVDPFEAEPELLRSAAWAIQGLTRRKKVVVEPVYLWSAYPLSAPLNIPHDVEAELAVRGQEDLESAIDRVHLKNLKPLKIVSEPYMQQRQGVEVLLDYARRSGADLVVLTTRARSGIKRWLFGSFAETLMLFSTLPTLVINPQWKRVDVFDQILFPTDFSRESKIAFRNVLSLAKSLGSKVTLFHKSLTSLAPLELYEGIYEEEVRDEKKELARWAKSAERKGVRCDVYLDVRLGKGIADAILEYSRENQTLVAMTSRRGPLSSALLGSVSRSVLREAPYPVWINHPPHRKERVSRRRASARRKAA